MEKLKVGEATVTEMSLSAAGLASAEAKKAGRYSELMKKYADFRTLAGIDPDENMSFPDVAEGLPETKEQFEATVNKSNLTLLGSKYSAAQKKHEYRAAAAEFLW